MAESVITVSNIEKHYNGVTAVDRLSFDVFRGEIFGLLGPNGAGKTTTIRILMDLIKPDAGQVRLLGAPPGEIRGEVGYLPEERGLYRDLTLPAVLSYLAELKGLSRSDAQARAAQVLERVGLADRSSSKVKDLSRGMQQKLQFAAAMVHDPALLVLDEPFQGLDPVNVDVVKSLIRELQAEGKTIVLSAHQMNLVEALCDRIVLINHGRALLYGELEAIKREHSPDAVRLRTAAPLDDLPGVARVQRDGPNALVTLDGASPQALLHTLVERGIPIELFEVETAPLEEIFVRVVREQEHA